MGVRKKVVQPILGPTVWDLVREDHPYRRLLELIPWDALCAPLEKNYSELGRGGYPVATIFKSLVLQWMEDLSDRELERYLEENIAGKLFCGFGLTDSTPDYSTFCVARKRIGTHDLAGLFNAVRDSLKEAGLVREVFTFVDATHLISKNDLWRERDKAIKAGKEKLDNSSVSELSADKEARFGRKGRLKWFGYKIHASVDMSNGFICRVAVTPANVEDTPAAKHVLPRNGMVFADKAYGVGASAREMRRRGLHSGAILKNSMKAKNADKDRWISSVRAPFESTFSQFEKRARYVGLVKTQFQAFMQALAFNCKRLIAIGAPPLKLGPITS